MSNQVIYPGTTVSVSNIPATQPVTVSNFPASQPVTVSNLPATQPVSVAALPLPTGAALDATIQALIGKFFAATAVITLSPSIPIGGAGAKLIDANPNRKGLYIYNNSANSIYIAFGSAANSSNNMTQIIATFQPFILPFPVYTGAIYAVRNAGSGNAILTELT